jgi:hypothetical protein
MKIEYKIGECKYCKKVTALKDGVCATCNRVNDKIDIPDFLQDIFNIKK